MKNIFRAGPLDYIVTKKYDIGKCVDCGHGLSHVDPSSLDNHKQLYEGGSYDSREKLLHRLLRPFLMLLERNKIGYLPQEGSVGKSILEIGCGKGRFLQAAKDSGYEVYGLEPSRRSCSFARQRLGDVVFPISFEQIREVHALDRKFDIIVLWHVLEHLPDPDDTLRKIKDHLAPDGTLLIAVPNMDSFQASYGREDWFHLDPPRHVNHFTPNSLDRIMRRNSFKVNRTHFNSFYQNFIGELITATNKILPDKNVIFNILRLNMNYIRQAGKARALTMLSLALLLTSVAFIPALAWTAITQVARKGGTMVVLAKLV